VTVAIQQQEKWMADYYSRTGLLWRQSFLSGIPRPPPILFSYPTDYIGQVHLVTSQNAYWTCSDTSSNHTCQNGGPLSFELEVASLTPRVIVIPNFLSTFEADAIIEMSKNQVKGSTVGDIEQAREDTTRTSRNTWIPRSKSPLTETLFRRAADVLNVDEALLHTKSNVEDIQVVHYVNGQKYDSHHDWGVSGYHESRYITMLMYLTDQADPDAGGETSFPKAGSGGGIKVAPVKGDAVLFYNLLEDGNGDDLSLHAALPVWRGEKWLANFWVWDPKRK
jgi:prolyl 4-hydroxylase